MSFPVPPDILDYPTSTDMVVREGSNVTLRCAASGLPTPNITWRRETGDKISLGSGHEGKRFHIPVCITFLTNKSFSSCLL